MARPAGHNPGHPAGFTWGDYLDWLVREAGTLAAVAERLSARGGHRDDVQSIERALRRLRTRGQGDGGKWGPRALAAFGLPGAADERARWMGAYHSRFTDLPVPVCEDLIRLWDRPPLNQSRPARGWLSLAQASCALRRRDDARAGVHLAEVRALQGTLPPEARAELLLTEAFVASHSAAERVPSLLDAVGPLLDAVSDAPTRACLQVRWVDQRAFGLNRSHEGQTPQYEASEALYRAVPTASAPPFVLSRRANGLAYVRWKLGHADEAASLAREASEHAGDGGHVRLRAMALSMLARVTSGDEAREAHARATAIAAMLDDETLRLRLDRTRPRR